MRTEIVENLKRYEQEQVLRFYNELEDSSRLKLENQLEQLDIEELTRLAEDYVINLPETTLPADLQPAPYFPLAPRSAEESDYYEKARRAGCELLRNGKVSALTVAGGQGTRLGFDGPKGTFPIMPVSGRTLFQHFAESLRRVGEKYGSPLTWYIMTSELNNAVTEQFFKDNSFFGLDPARVVFFVQGAMPAFDCRGKLLLAEKDSLALAPDGHGGTLLALRKCGCLDRMAGEGVEYISYFQVDNPLVSVVNPLFLGLHVLENSDMSALTLKKTGPDEKLGNFCVSEGRLMIIEYSDLPDELAQARDAEGNLKFIAGSPAIHVISREFVERLTASGRLALPWHRADKKIPYIGDHGEKVIPEQPNGVKLESFIFDALPLAGRTMILEADRREEFAPVKNQTGVDSVVSSREMLIDRDARRLERAGVSVPRDQTGKSAVGLEISPLAVIDDADCAAYCRRNRLNTISLKDGGVFLQ